jgi:hypothetical protein
MVRSVARYPSELTPPPCGALTGPPAPGTVLIRAGRRRPGPVRPLPDRDAIQRYLRTHYLSPAVADRVSPPLTLTKRGCLVIASKDE